jgi:hypothetical protein
VLAKAALLSANWKEASVSLMNADSFVEENFLRDLRFLYSSLTLQ